MRYSCTRPELSHGAARRAVVRIQGYLAHKKQPLPRTLQEAHAEGLMVFLSRLMPRAGLFLISEAPL